jgi:tetratricopeptide (TPR) repeat protein
LDQFSSGLEDRLTDQPEVEATLRQIIGSVYTRLRIVDQAEPHLQRSLELHRQVFGEDHIKFADSLRYLAWNKLEKDRTDADIETMARQALSVYQKHGDTDRTLQAVWLLLLSLDGQSKADEAESAANDALRLANASKLGDHPIVANVLHQLAWIKIRQDDFATAERLARDSVAKHLRAHGELHPETAFGWRYLGAALQRQGKFADAEACYRNALTIYRRSFPEGHEFIRTCSSDMMWALRQQAKHEATIEFCQEVIRVEPGNAAAHIHLAWALSTCPDRRLRDTKKAVDMASKAVRLSPNIPEYWSTLAFANFRHGNIPAAIAAELRGIAVRVSSHFGNDLGLRNWLAKALLSLRQLAISNQKLLDSATGGETDKDQTAPVSRRPDNTR